jgi:hypothetical protein
MNSMMFVGVGIQLLNVVLLVGIIGMCVYGFVLFVKLAKRGIKALDIYINENKPNLDEKG